MALCGVSFLPARDALRISFPLLNSSHFPCSRRSSGSRVTWRRQATCSLRKIDSAAPSGAGKAAVEADEEIGPVMKFRMSDFAISAEVSVGLHGRADELIFEATVCDPNSPLYKSSVVLRQLTTAQAKRRGRRALEVLKKLARRKLMYHSYAMQVYGYVFSSDIGDDAPFTLVHGYHGSYSLRHWLQLSDWLPTLEVTLALDEECLRRVGDDTTGGPAVSRQHRLTRILMRDLLIAVNYLHSHGLAHTELRLENVHISPVDKHVKIPHLKRRQLIRATYYLVCTRIQEALLSLFKIGILGNAADFNNSNPNPNHSNNEVNNDRRKLMIAFDMRCVGFIMARLILKELMDASIFLKFKSFLTKGNDPSCLREFLLPILCRDSPSGNPGLQIMDRNWGAGWNLLSQLLALKPSKRISCLDALRHPFLCGPKWRTGPSMDLIRWGLGSTAVRMSEDYIYVGHQRSRIAYFIELMELLNPNPRTKGWLNFLPGRWRLLYSTGRHIGLTLRQTTPRVLIDDAYLTLRQASVSDHRSFLLVSDISFKIIPTPHWPHDKSGPTGSLRVKSLVKICPGRRHYPKEDDSEESRRFAFHNSASGHLSTRKWKGMDRLKELPASLPAVKLTVDDDIDVSMKLDSSSVNANAAKKVLQEVRTQIPFEMFDVSKFVCGTYVDSRMMVLRGVSGSALLFTRSCSINENV